MEVELHAFLTPALNRDEWTAHLSGFIPGNEPLLSIGEESVWSPDRDWLGAKQEHHLSLPEREIFLVPESL